MKGKRLKNTSHEFAILATVSKSIPFSLYFSGLKMSVELLSLQGFLQHVSE